MKEKSGLGSALRRRIGSPVVPAAGRRPALAESVLMNTTRLRIFQAVCNFPCSHVRWLSKNVGVAPPSVQWHLGKLSEKGLVRSLEAGGRRLFYACGMLEEEDLALLSLLARENRRAAVLAVCQNPGVTQRQLARASGSNGHAIRTLTGQGVLDVVKDGRHRRYYPGAALERRMEEHEKRARKSRQLLLSTLAREGVLPETADSGRGILEVRVHLGGATENLRFRRNPYDFSRL